ncbi:hypothetical protein HAHI6034_09045 [Hathewaya histolytica]|uniref:Uncharacterized protein n=1 Tax=Hathewaya histolytica TaxID=1498 RepID=A0A4U9RR57_HATHI|nr:Uncharacterised protein [Hathewaya histolytica]
MENKKLDKLVYLTPSLIWRGFIDYDNLNILVNKSAHVT